MGSSPLTRGKLRHRCRRLRRRRLIPAHAGKTRSTDAEPWSRRAHPRSRGENWRWACRSSRSGGSSPLTRGKLPRRRDLLPNRRLIPAHAGKTGQPRVQRGVEWAHPRSRGENSSAPDSATWPRGSSPLTRGKPTGRHGRSPKRRLIPAHAGKTLYVDVVPSMKGAHPRSRGENTIGCGGVGYSTGSSPLTRGKRMAMRIVGRSFRLIPAHAGKTLRRTRRSSISSAHPRSRGENPLTDSESARARGSSPLTRGKPLGSFIRDDADRLIPAHAGKTSAWRTASTRRTAHPRSRGENADREVPNGPVPGSSPLTRGKRCMASSPQA